MHERFLQYLAQQSASAPQTQTATGTPAAPPTAVQDTMQGYIPMMMIAVFFAVIYFTILRPQRKEEKRKKEMLEKLQKGDAVITTSGMIGTVANIKEDIVILKIGDGVKVEFLRSAISAVKNSAAVKAETSK
jgi:preprotein translocase subunit YajC